MAVLSEIRNNAIGQTVQCQAAARGVDIIASRLGEGREF
jgi:hypothetical protein